MMVPFDSMMAFVRAPLVVRVAVGAATSAFAATHDAVVPLLEVHTQFHGPVPTTPLAVPTEQRLLAGALLTVVPLAEPQAPLTWAVAVVFVFTVCATMWMVRLTPQTSSPIRQMRTMYGPTLGRESTIQEKPRLVASLSP